MNQEPDPAERLLEISSTALSTGIPHALPRLAGAEPLLDELYDLLLRRNGFLAFESALHVYPSDPWAKAVWRCAGCSRNPTSRRGSGQTRGTGSP